MVGNQTVRPDAPVLAARAAGATGSTQQWIRTFRRLLGARLAGAGLVITGLVIAMALVADFITPYDPGYQDYNAVLQSPSADHWLGTDDVGRDIYSRIVYGARVSLQVGIASVLFAVIW